eukprot:RCo022811
MQMPRLAVRWFVHNASPNLRAISAGGTALNFALVFSRRCLTSNATGSSTGSLDNTPFPSSKACDGAPSVIGRGSQLSGSFIQLCRSIRSQVSLEQRKELELLANEISDICGDLSTKELALFVNAFSY